MPFIDFAVVSGAWRGEMLAKLLRELVRLKATGRPGQAMKACRLAQKQLPWLAMYPPKVSKEPPDAAQS